MAVIKKMINNKMQYSTEEINNRFNNLPEELKGVINSTQTLEKIEVVANKHSLMLDQAGELSDELGLFMLGLTKQNDFVKNLSRRLGVSEEKAMLIAKDIDKEILDVVRSSLQKIQSEAEATEQAKTTPPPTPLYQAPQQPPQNPNLSHIEKVGNFTIEKRPPSNSPQYNDSTLKKDAVLNDLENIKNLKPENANAFVEHLLANPVSSPKQTEIKKEAPAQKYGADPYREQV